MKFVLASTNKAKVEAVKKVLNEYFSNIEITSVSVESNVSKTPLSDEEGLRGCLNRIETLRKEYKNYDGYIGLEGIVTTVLEKYFVSGWCIIELNGRQGIGCSAKVLIPSKIAEKINSNTEFKDLIKNEYPNVQEEKSALWGANGVITNGIYSRVDEFEDSVRCALGYILNEDNFKK